MTSYLWKIPTEEDMTIPRWARIALAARTVRRVQPLLLAAWPEVPKKILRAVEFALSEAELAASQGAMTPDQDEAISAGMDAYGARFKYDSKDQEDISGYVIFAAAHASYAAKGLKASHVPFVIAQAMWAVHHYERRAAQGIVKSTVEAIWQDTRCLIELAEAGKWNNNTPVSMDVFGPMWTKRPKHWPMSPKMSRPIKRRKRASAPQFENLKLAVCLAILWSFCEPEKLSSAILKPRRPV